MARSSFRPPEGYDESSIASVLVEELEDVLVDWVITLDSVKLEEIGTPELVEFKVGVEEDVDELLLFEEGAATRKAATPAITMTTITRTMTRVLAIATTLNSIRFAEASGRINRLAIFNRDQIE